MVTQQDETSRPKQAAPRFVIGEGSSRFNATLCCPQCGDGHVHLGPVLVDQGHTSTLVERDHALTLPSNRSDHYRGSKIDLTLWCEAGHEFRYVLAFDRGATYATMATRDAGMPGEFLQPELWRD